MKHFSNVQETTSDGRKVVTTAVLQGNRLIKTQVIIIRNIWTGTRTDCAMLHAAAQPGGQEPQRGGDAGVQPRRPQDDADPHDAQQAKHPLRQGLQEDQLDNLLQPAELIFIYHTITNNIKQFHNTVTSPASACTAARACRRGPWGGGCGSGQA